MDARVVQLLNLLDERARETVGTSVRIPVALRDAAGLAAELGWGASATDLTVQGLRAVLEALVQRAVLDAHYVAHPGTRPDLGDIALATAAIDGNPLCDRPDLVRRAAEEIARVRDDPTPDDVLVYAAGLAAAAA